MGGPPARLESGPEGSQEGGAGRQDPHARLSRDLPRVDSSGQPFQGTAPLPERRCAGHPVGGLCSGPPVSGAQLARPFPWLYPRLHWALLFPPETAWKSSLMLRTIPKAKIQYPDGSADLLTLRSTEGLDQKAWVAGPGDPLQPGGREGDAQHAPAQAQGCSISCGAHTGRSQGGRGWKLSYSPKIAPGEMTGPDDHAGRAAPHPELLELSADSEANKLNCTRDLGFGLELPTENIPQALSCIF